MASLITLGGGTTKGGGGTFTKVGEVVDNLNGTSATDALSANMGRVLNAKIESKVFAQGGVPFDEEPTIGNTSHVVSSDGMAKAFNSQNARIELIEAYQSAINSKTPRYIDLFKKCIFIGDSVTEGAVVDTRYSLNKITKAYGYPQRLGQLVPTLKIYNQGTSGESTQGWNKNRFENEYRMISDGVDLCVMELGWNQTQYYSWKSSMSAFNTSLQNDVIAHGDDFANYNTTNSVVGNYCQLVKKILNCTPNVTLVLVVSAGLTDLIANQIKGIAQWANLPCIDLHNIVPDGGDECHFTAMGYVYKAHVMLNELNKVFADNERVINERIYRQNGWIK